MTRQFCKVDTGELEDNVFKLIDQDWMLVTAGSRKHWNTMTASWGAWGELWNRRVAFAFVRPTRYTYEFMEDSRRFTLSFFPEKHRKALTFCGTHSGRDCDKARETGLEPFAPSPGTVSFRQARLILVCRKLYTADIDPQRFLDPRLDLNYPKQDYHRMYVGEVTLCLRSL
ncbi:flavin reductase family protein [candidate division WOR-3 bacterium]|nr:flavin reductase family protein [candidate division WOR-3 bacterium]